MSGPRVTIRHIADERPQSAEAARATLYHAAE